MTSLPTKADMKAMSIGIYNLILKDLLALSAEIFDARRPEHTHGVGESCLVDELSEEGECWIYSILLNRMTRFASEIDASIAPDNTLFQWLRGDKPDAYADGVAHLDDTALLPEPEFTAIQQYAIHYGLAHLLETEIVNFVEFVESKSPQELDEYVERPEVMLYMRTIRIEIHDIMPKVEIARAAWRLSEEDTTIVARDWGSDG